MGGRGKSCIFVGEKGLGNLLIDLKPKLPSHDDSSERPT